MAHFAQIDENNLVIQVVVVSNDVLNNEPFPQSESIGVAFCKSIYGQDTNWAQTSYSGSFRYNYAGIGYAFDANANAFIAESPYPSWVLNTETYRWQSPIPPPQDGNRYYWDEDQKQWVLSDA